MVQIQVSRRVLVLLALVLLALVLVAVPWWVRGRAASAPVQHQHTPMSAEGWSQLFWNAPGEREIGDGSVALTGRATWIRRVNGGDEVSLRVREGAVHTLMVPDSAFVYRAEEFFSAGYPQPTAENPREVLAQLRDTPVMVRIDGSGRVTTVFVLLEVKQ